MSASQSRQLAELIERLEPEARLSFEAAIRDLHKHIDWPALIAALTIGDTTAAVAALNISEAAFLVYSQAVSAAFVAGGQLTAEVIAAAAQGGIGIRFNMQNPLAEAWAREFSSTKITAVVQEQREVARTMIGEGYLAGNHPHTIATDLAGRVGAGGIREGGAFGLDLPRAQRLSKVTNGMRTEDGVKSLVIESASGELKMRYKVNKATEKRILKAYKAGTEVPVRDRIIIERQYSNALLKQRAETVARTEVAGSVMAARDIAWRQAAEANGLDANAVRKVWRHRRGASGRPDHIEMAGVAVMGLDAAFTLPDGTIMLYPHDPNGGAAHVINCACDCDYRLVRG